MRRRNPWMVREVFTRDSSVGVSAMDAASLDTRSLIVLTRRKEEIGPPITTTTITTTGKETGKTIRKEIPTMERRNLLRVERNNQFDVFIAGSKVTRRQNAGNCTQNSSQNRQILPENNMKSHSWDMKILHTKLGSKNPQEQRYSKQSMISWS